MGMPDPAAFAAGLLVWAKRTRIEVSPEGLEAAVKISEEERLAELNYIAATIPASWEFVDFVFVLQGVTRAFTQQMTRTRNLSFAQQTLQELRVDGFGYDVGPTVRRHPEAEDVYHDAMDQINAAYTSMIELGVEIQDARGVLPLNILTNLVVKGNLRSLADILRKRASPRNQGARPGYEGEWACVHREMKRLMVSALPWTDLFLNRTEDQVAADMYKMLESITDKTLRVNLTKGIDQLLTNVGGEP
jgi:hypothetical protein